MSTATLEAEPELIPDPIPERDDITKAKRHVFNRHLAHEAIMLDRMQRQLRMAEKAQKFATTGNTKDLEWTVEDESAMGVSIGNENHLHIQTKEQPQVTTAAAPMPAPASTSQSVWPSLLLAGSMLAGGSGLGYIVNDLLKSRPAALPAVTDTDTTTVIDFPDE